MLEKRLCPNHLSKITRHGKEFCGDHLFDGSILYNHDTSGRTNGYGHDSHVISEEMALLGDI